MRKISRFFSGLFIAVSLVFWGIGTVFAGPMSSACQANNHYDAFYDYTDTPGSWVNNQGIVDLYGMGVNIEQHVGDPCVAHCRDLSKGLNADVGDYCVDNHTNCTNSCSSVTTSADRWHRLFYMPTVGWRSCLAYIDNNTCVLNYSALPSNGFTAADGTFQSGCVSGSWNSTYHRCSCTLGKQIFNNLMGSCEERVCFWFHNPDGSDAGLTTCLECGSNANNMREWDAYVQKFIALLKKEYSSYGTLAGYDNNGRMVFDEFGNYVYTSITMCSLPEDVYISQDGYVHVYPAPKSARGNDCPIGMTYYPNIGCCYFSKDGKKCDAQFLDVWQKMLKLEECSPAAGYVNSNNQVTCCPAGTTPDVDSAMCLCASGYEFNRTTGQCEAKVAECLPGYYFDTTNQICTICPAGHYCPGGVLSNVNTGLNDCPTLTSGYQYTSDTGLIQPTQCREIKRPDNCDGGYITKTAVDATTWGAGVSTLTAAAGYKLSGSGENQMCVECGDAYYSTGNNSTTSCTACPAARENTWTVHTTSTTATSWSACYETQTPEHCTSGTVKQDAISASAYSSTITLLSSLSAADGYYAATDAITCSACSALTPGVAVTGGVFSSVSPRTASTHCGYTAPTRAAPANCYSSTPQTVYYDAMEGWPTTGYYIVTANAGAYLSDSSGPEDFYCTLCPTGSYNSQSGHRITSCTACGSGTTTTGTGQTSCNATCPNNTSYVSSWASASWNSTTHLPNNLCTVSTCGAGSYYNSANNGSCEPCTGATYMNSTSHTNTSCIACPVAETGWTQGTGTGWIMRNDCYETINATTISQYCSTGMLTRNQFRVFGIGGGGWQWSNTNEDPTFTPISGSIVDRSNDPDGLTCAQCTCTPGAHVASCTAGAASGDGNNICNYTYTCATGYNNGGASSGSFSGNENVSANTSPDCATANTYTITFKSGDTVLGTQSCTYGTTVTLNSISTMSNIPVSSNYGWAFDGWATVGSNIPTVVYQDSASTYSCTGDAILRGVWSRNVAFKYYADATATTVTTSNKTQYYRDNQWGVADASYVVNDYLLYTSTQSESGWEPVGWRTDSYAMDVPGASLYDGVHTLWTSYSIVEGGVNGVVSSAVYKRKPVIAYNGNTNTGGSTANTECTDYQYYNASGSVSSASSCTLATNGFTKTGYTFNKWAAGSASGTQYAAGASYTYPNTTWASEQTYTMYASWNANVSGAIALNSNRFANSGDANAAQNATTAASPTPVYTRYATGVYASSANATNNTNAITALSTLPVMTGYTFQGFYTGKAGSGTQVVDSSGTFLAAAKTAVSAAGGTATWYAHWTATPYTLTITSGNGIRGVEAGGGFLYPVNSDATWVYKTVNYNGSYDISAVVPAFKRGYSGYTYTITSGSGSLNGTTFTAGAGDTTITINATTLAAPTAVTISGGATKVYNYQTTGLSTSVTTPEYADGVSVNYQFKSANYTNSTCGSYSNVGTASTTSTYTVAKDAFRGYKCYSVNAYAVGDGGLTSSSVSPSSATTVGLINRTITFNATTNGGTLSGTSPLYASYNNAALYTTATGTTAGTAPTASISGYSYNRFKGWYTAASGGSAIYIANAAGTSVSITSAAVSGYTSSSKWVATADKTLHAQYCAVGYTWNGSSCVVNSYRVTVNAGNGISTVAATGWTNTGTASMYKDYNYNTAITLSSTVTPTRKNGYTGTAYTVTSGSCTISNGTLTVGDGDCTVAVNATGITAPTAANVTITGGTEKTYNKSATTLTGAYTISPAYDSGISVNYSFGYSSTSNGTYSGWTTASTSTTTNVAAAAFHGTRYYKVRVQAVGEGGLTSGDAVVSSGYTTVSLPQREITFNANEGTLSGTSPLYARYNNANLYNGVNSDTTATVPTATRTGYTFAGWYTAATNGLMVYSASNALQTSVSGYTNSSAQWAVDENKTLYARWTANTNTLTLNKNGGTGTIKNNAGTTYTGSTAGSMTCTTGSSVNLPTWASAASSNNTTNIANGSKVFLGWSTDQNATTGSFSITCPTGNATYYAVWKTPTCTATHGTATATTTVDNKPTCAVTCDCGYQTSGTYSGTAGATSYSYTCTARTVTFTWANGGHGTAPTTPASCTYDGTFTMPAAMTATGYTFNKWNTSGTTTTQFNAGQTNVACTSANLGNNACTGTATITGSWTTDQYRVTVNAGNGISTVAATGWTNSGTASMYKDHNYNSSIDLSSVVTPTHKNGYTGVSYSVSGSCTLSGSTVTLGAGACEITVSATGITAPTGLSLTKNPTSTQTFNYMPVVLTESHNATNYDSGISVTYQFGYTSYSSSTCGTSYTYDQAQATNTYSVAKNAYRGSKCYKAKVTVTGDGGLSTSAETDGVLVKFVQRAIVFNIDGTEGSGETLSTGDISKTLYSRYDTANLYTSSTGNTSAAAPTATKDGGYKFNGWWTTASGGSQILTAANALTSNTVSGYIANSVWKNTSSSKNVYAQFTAMNVSAPDKTLTYNGSAQSCANVTVTSPSGATVTYSTTESGPYGSAPTMTNVSESPITVYYKVSATGYTDMMGSYTCTMNKADCTLGFNETSGSTPYGTNKTFTVTSNPSGGTLTVSPTATGTGINATASISGTTVTMTPRAVGNQTITVTSAATSNYNSCSKNYTLTVSKGNCTVNLSATSGTITYPTANTTFTASSTSGGTLTVSPTATGSGIHATAAISNGTVTVTPQSTGSQTITVTSAATTNYNACSATYTATVNAKTITLKKNNGSGTCGGVTGTADGSMTCTYGGTCTAPSWNSSTCNITNGANIFDGWATSASGAVAYAPNADLTNAPTTLYAHWNTCTACNAGTGASCELSVVNNTCTYTTSCLPGYDNITGNGTATPSCTPNTYTISYALNNGTAGSNAPTTGTYNTEFTVDNPTHAHGTFNGWAVSGMDSTTHYYGETSANTSSTATSWANTTITPAKKKFKNLRATSGTVTFTAKWTCATGYTGDDCHAATYTITYKTGNNTMGTQTCTYGTTVTLNPVSGMNNIPVTTANGWSFDGWATNYNTTTTDYADGATTYSCTGDATLYGVWHRRVFVRGGSFPTRWQNYYNITASTADVDSVELVSLTNSMVTYGWEPYGWAYQSTTSVVADVATTPNADAPVVTPGVTDGNRSGVYYYALFKRLPTILYDGNTNTGGSTVNTECDWQYLNIGGDGSANSSGCTLANNGFTKDGYAFNKWAAGSASGTQYAAGASYTFPNTDWASAKTYTMYATWTANTNTPYKVYHYTKDLTGSAYTQNGSVDNLTGTSDASVTLSTLTRNITGFTYDKGFAGTAAAGTTMPAANTAVTTTTILPDGTRVISLYYNRNGYTITLNKNGGSGKVGNDTTVNSNPATMTCTYGDTVTLPAYNSTTQLTKGTGATSAVFRGWADNNDCTATTCAYTGVECTGDKTVYAVWIVPTCAAGTGVGATSLNSVSGNAPVCNKTASNGNYCTSATQTGTAGATSLTVTCTACPAVDSRWAYVSGTGWTSYSQCQEEKSGANCASGKLTKTATSASAWGDAVSTLTAPAGSYVNGESCDLCATGSYTATAGTQTSCTMCTGGTTTNGTGQTSCNATCVNNNDYDHAWATPTWNNNNPTDICTVSSCKKGSYFVSLPDGYTQLEYIASTGTQWINTGISGFNTGDWEIYAKWLLPVETQTQSYANVFGVYSSENHNSYRVITQQTNSGAYYVSGNSKAGGGSALVTDKAINQIHTATVRNGSVIFDGETINTPTQGTALPSNVKLGIFARSDAASKIIARIYSVNVKKDGVLIGNFVPAKRNSDGVLGMYDTVNGVFYTNAGSGTFVAGPALQGKNLFNDSLLAGDTSTLIYTSFSVPNGTYTMSSPDYPFTAGITNVFFLAGNVSSGVNSTTNGVASTRPITITVTDGYYTVAHRYDTIANPADPRNYKWQIEQGSTATDYQPYGVSYANSCEECVGATYQATDGSVATACTACPTNYTYNTDNGKTAASQCQIHCDGGSYVAPAPNNTNCSNVGTGYWSAGGVVNYGSTGTRTACPTGMTTTGSGTGADEAGDCGRVLHVGNYSMRLRSVQKTTPSLKFDTDNNGVADLFGNMGTTQRNMSSTSNKKFKVNRGGTTYYIYDDTAVTP